MADTLEAIFEEYGIKGGLSPAPTGGRFSQLDVDLANKEAREKSKNFFSLVKEQQLTTGTSIAAINYFTTPEPEELEFTEEVAKDLLEDITDPKIIKKVLEAGTEKGTAYARKIITEYGQQQEFYSNVAAAGGQGTVAGLAGAILDPADTATALATGAAITALQPQFAPITAPASVAAVKGYKIFEKLKTNRAALLASVGIGAVEQAGLELLRKQTVHDVSGNDVILAAFLGAGVTGGVTKYGQYARKRAAILEAQRKQVDGEALTAADEAVLKTTDEEQLAEYFRGLAQRSDDFNTQAADELEPDDFDPFVGIQRKDYTETTEGEIEATPFQRGNFSGLRSLVAVVPLLKNSSSGLVRWLSDGLALNSLGNRGGQGVGSNALDYRDTLIQSTLLRNAVEVKNLYKSAEQTTGLKQFQIEELVGDYMRSPNPNAAPEIKRIAQIYSEDMDRAFDLAAQSNAAGFTAEAKKLRNYLPRKANRINFAKYRLGNENQAALLPDVKGEINEGFVDLFETAIRNAQPNLNRRVRKMLREKGVKKVNTKKFIRAMAKAYAKNFLAPPDNLVRKLGDGLADVEEAVAIFTKGGLSDNDARLAVELLSLEKTIVANPRAKHRVNIDETASIQVTGADGSVFTLRMADLLERNARVLHESYLFQVSGSTALAVNGINTNKLGSNFHTILNKIPAGDAKRNKEIQSLEFLYDTLTGNLVYRSGFSPTTNRNLARLREANFILQMGMSGMAAIMELTNVINEVSFNTILKTTPQLNNLIVKARTGQLGNRAAHEMMVLTGVGGDGLLNKVTSRRNRLEGGVGEGEDYLSLGEEVTWLDETLGKGRIMMSIASGLQGVTDILRRWSSYNFAQEFTTRAREGVIPFSAIKREQLGISDADAKLINEQIIANADILDDGTLDGLNLNKWDNQARNVFLQAVRREATQSVQEVNNGSVSYWLRSEVGKSFFQFLTFPMASMEQQAGRLAVRAANGDSVQVAKILGSAAFMGTLMYVARTHLNSINRSDREQYLERFLSPSQIGIGALSQVGAASLFGYIYQTTTGLMDGQTRAITPASASMLISGLSGAKDLGEMIAGNELSETELRSLLRLLPFSSLYGARQILNGVATLAD
jgi:hypothetical protein